MAYGEVRKGVSERLRQRHGCLEGTGRLFRFYNDQWPHQALCYRTSSKVFHEAIYAPAEEPRNRGMQRSEYCNHQQERWDSRLTQPQSCPTNGVHRQYTVGSQDLVQPGFQLLRLNFILIPGDLDPRLYPPNGNGRNEELLRWHIRDLIHDGAMWTGATQLRDHVGIEEVHEPTPRPRAFGGDAVGAAA